MAIIRGTTFTPDKKAVEKAEPAPPKPVSVVETNPLIGKLSMSKYDPIYESKKEQHRLRKILGLTEGD